MKNIACLALVAAFATAAHATDGVIDINQAKIDGDEPGAGVDVLVARHAGLPIPSQIGALSFRLAHSKMRR